MRRYANAELVELAITAARESMAIGGGPFGAVIARDGQMIAVGRNQSAMWHDPTAHAEILAIREAGRRLGTRDLSSCVGYCSCEPCPMCLAAFYWARVPQIYYGSSSADAEAFGYEDSFIYTELSKPPDKRKILLTQLPSPTARQVLEDFQANKEEIK